MNDRIERRVAHSTWPDADLDFRAEGDGLHFRGYAAVFGKPSQPLPFVETIRQGAFAKTLREKDAKKVFLNHNTDIVLGSTRQSFALSEDDRGLLADGDLPDNEWGRPVADGIRRKDIESMSFGFQTVKDVWTDDQGTKTAPWEGNHRELIEVKLFEVSIVTAWPAYTQTSASVRALAGELHLDADEVAEALRSLEAGADLTSDQVGILTQAINAKRRVIVPARLAHWREQFAPYN